MLPHRILDYKTFKQLYVLLQGKADTLGEAAICITEKILEQTESSWNYGRSQFLVLVSPALRVLLIGTPLGQSSVHELPYLQVELTFDTQPIAVFLKQLVRELSNPSLATKALKKVIRTPQVNSAYLQGELMLQILSRIEESESGCQEGFAGTFMHPARQERLFYQIIAQMQQGVELPTILSTAMEEWRSLLQVDRLLIYQFDVFPNTEESSIPFPQNWGYITYEAKGGNSITPVLHLTEEKSCFAHGCQGREKYKQGWMAVISDVEISYRDSPCLLDLLRHYHVRAKLVIPILVRKQIWGLMIAHQCHYPRRWLEWEKHTLKRLADYLAIAIDRSQTQKDISLISVDSESVSEESEKSLSDLQSDLLKSQIQNRIKSEFLAAISHELRTPLTYIIGMSATLLRLAFSPDSDGHKLSIEKQRVYLQKIQDSGRNLLESINNLLDLSQLEAGKTVLNIRKFSLINLARNCKKSLKSLAEEKEINLVINIDGLEGEDTFFADQYRVQQILLNLMNNALKFTPEGGEVILTIWREEDRAIFQVEDTGIGIKKNAFSFLFEKFQQLETAYERQYPGMGLGLALTRQLVELHGGLIEVDSTLGVGSIFTVSLPSQPQGTVSLKSSGHTPLNPWATTIPLGRLVLIQDNEQMAWEICDLLTAAGYQAIWLLDGSTVTQQIEVLRPLAIITETQLPDMSVQELITILRNSTTTYKIKVVAIADSSEQQELSQDPLTEPDVYLNKPLQLEELLQTLSRILMPK
ncbi:MAG: GAF domain-containing protein [Roseofilum sp. SBFL]|uniref:hybrid sensor histidine kinase/response regulator n=1 Tax=unclassified Roseofilum TaxID=2620099 RepID=UPI001B0841C6|nr:MULTISPECIES: ATP-binding protein [unclassified Roseofilum]MBP0012172.1 GAF domain-containing protein [Roseofilum sp. SID3]MBP0024920.1 GAF domain-containing protein [Roseofilum sp. SID2]MBP0039036.1 GAF domain-containing protein [Roseofilum sp. SID1]MBP0043619.1 GAF domain-containing protein [Roseofilum sp. SBFL]